MASKRLPNPNTAYGRKRIRNEQGKPQTPTSEEESSNFIFGLLFLILLVGLALWIRSMNTNDYYGQRGGHFKINSHGNKEYYKK